MALVGVDTYLASLPAGIDSYPQCAHKGEPLAVWLRRSPTAGLATALPAQVARLLDRDQPLPAWLPEVHANVLYLAIREAQFPDDAAFLEHARACNRAVLQTPTNRVLFWVASPRAILRAAGVRWGSLHRGSSIEVNLAGDTSVQAVLHTPPGLFPDIVLRGMLTAFEAALENAGARDVRSELRRPDATRAVIEARWL